MVKRKLGELLEGSGHISAQTLVRAIEEQKSKLTHLGEVLFENSLVEKEALVAALTEVMAIAYVDCENAKPDPAALQLLPAKIADRYNVLPLRFEGRKLVIVMSEPQDLDKLSQIRFSAGCDLSPRFGFKAEIARAIRTHYGTAPAESQAAETEKPPCLVSEEPGIEFFSNSKRQSNIEAMRELQAEMLNRSTPAVTEASAIVQEAIRRGASDIHIEPLAGETSGSHAARRNSPRGPASSAATSRRAGFAREDSLRYGYRRAPRAPGWPLHGEDFRAPVGCSRFHAAHAIWRENRNAASGWLGRHKGIQRVGFPGTHSG